MGEFGAGLIIGGLAAVVSFVLVGFTPAVYDYDIDRAEKVCSKSRWVELDNDKIYCEDGAEYPRKEEK